MPRKKGTLPPIKESAIVLRAIVMQSGVTDVVVATEQPVRRYDEERGYVINEVLLMDGVVLRTNQQQMPIVDSHDDSTVRNILGSIRSLKVINGELHGEPVFASDDAAQLVRQRMDEGHITDFSITALPLESVFIPRGQDYTTSRGAVIAGPAIIHTRWQPHNASICATGADELSTVRRSYTDLERKVTRQMEESLLGTLTAMGMPEGMTDPNQILAWVCGKMGNSAPAMTEPIESIMDGPVVPPVEEKPEEEKEVENMATEDKEKEVTEAVARALKIDGKRRKEINALCTVHKIERSFADELCDGGVSLNDARVKILERMAGKPAGQTSGERVQVTESADDKIFAAARDGLIVRSFAAGSIRKQVASPAAGHEDFVHMKLNRVAEMYVARMGVDVRRMAPKDIALVAMGHPGALNRHRIQRDAFHTTGSFTNLLLDAANKTLLAAYDEAEFTWTMWARNAGTTADFKALNRIRFSEMGVPEMVPEGHDYPDAPMSDSKESYKINKYGNVFTISWETVVNDDMDAISRIPAMQGNACRRLQNNAVYAVLTANAAMADTGALFNATAQTTAGGHANLTTGAGAPSETTLNEAYKKMMIKTGLTTTILGLVPKFLIVPPSLSATADQLVTSQTPPTVGGSAVGTAGINNLYGPTGSRRLTVVVEPQLEANSATAWYLAADNRQVDTVEITFLEGEQSPVIESEWDFDKDVYKNKVRQTFGVAPIDWRGLYKHAGA